MGLGYSLFSIGSSCILASLYPKDLTKAMSYWKTFFAVGMLLGLLLGTLIYGVFGHVAVFVFWSVLTLAALFVQWRMIPDE